jgi:murein DD-endopeptidase MepM/ murein hydrolase activator NlpD
MAVSAAQSASRPDSKASPPITLRSRALRPGEVLVATIATPSAAGDSITVTAFGKEWPAVRTSTGAWRCLIGIDLDTAPGHYIVSVATSGDRPFRATRAITVVPRRFRVRTLRVAPDYVNPPAEIQARIVADNVLMREVFAHPATDAAWTGGFGRPVPGPANSSFGTRSVFNGEPRSPHGGTDFLSPAGTPVQAPAGGRVVVARDLFFTGNTVVIDHGLGVFSTLAHLSRIDVREGTPIARGDIVGLVGATGRVTGPHLHWSLRVSGARVDPLSALALLPPAP